MRPIRELFAGVIRSGEDGAALYAAAAVAAANQQLQARWAPSDAQAASYERGNIMVRVSHSAIAGMIDQEQEKILEATNQALQRQFPGLYQPVNHLSARVNL